MRAQPTRLRVQKPTCSISYMFGLLLTQTPTALSVTADRKRGAR